MAALLQASTALSAQWRGTLSFNVSLRSPPPCRSVSSFRNTSLGKLSWDAPKPCIKRHTISGRVGVARAAGNPDTIIEKTCQVGDHFLDAVSNWVLRQTHKLLSNYIPADWDPLHFLPVNLQSHLKKSEALATLVLRELLVFALFYLVYRKVDIFCKWLYSLYTRNKGNDKKFNQDDYKTSPFRAARTPLRNLVMIWGSTRLLWVLSILCKMEAMITPELIYDIRGTVFVCTITWFLMRWKRLYVERFVIEKPEDESRIFAIDKMVSLAMYGLAASCIAEVLGMALGSLLAVGGVSGLAVGLAAQEVVGNMFGGASLFISRPFVIGEKIKAGDVSGHVVDIGFMNTKVQGFDGVPLLVPNQAFTSQVITNFSRAKTRVLEASFQLNNRHIFMVDSITAEVTKYLASHPRVEIKKSSPICYLRNMEDDGPEIALSCAIKSIGGEIFYRVQQEILIHVAEIITDILGPDSPFTPLEDSDTDLETSNNNEGLVQ